MTNSKTKDFLEDQPTFPLDIVGALAGQVFSNHLLVDQIWKHLPTQDIIRTALVSRAWHANSRRTLRYTKSKRAVYLYVDNDSPCRTLAKFNEFLEEISQGAILEHYITFNGINLLANPRSYYTRHCRDCLKKELIVEDEDPPLEGVWDPVKVQLVMEKLPQLYGQILDKFQFRYFRIHNFLTRYCPFACLMKYWIQTRREDILKLDFGRNDGINYYLIQDLLWENLRQNQNMKEFPNLVAFGANTFYHTSLPIVAPSLRKILHFFYDPASNEVLPTFLRHAITSLITFTSNEQWLTKILEFVKKYNPTLEFLILSGNYNARNIRTENIFELGRIAHATVEKLTCSSLILTFLTTRTDESQKELQNWFPALHTLTLQCFADETAKVFDWLNCVEVRKIFPKLHQVNLRFRETASKYNHSASNGPENVVIKDHRGFNQVKHLKLISSVDYVHSVKSAVNWIHLFKNIQQLNLTGMRFRYYAGDRWFGEVLNEIVNLQFLKILTIAPPDLNYFCLDHLFSENIPDLKGGLAGLNVEHLRVYQSSLLYHNSLDQIIIQREKICTYRIKTTGEIPCYSDQSPGTFLISDGTARAICEKRPGFKFCMTMTGPCMCECSSGFWPDAGRLEHLEPFASMNFVQSRAGICVTRCWEVKFLKLTRA